MRENGEGRLGVAGAAGVGTSTVWEGCVACAGRVRVGGEGKAGSGSSGDFGWSRGGKVDGIEGVRARFRYVWT